MKKQIIFLLLVVLVVPASKACSPARRPFIELLNFYNPKYHIIVEGFFQAPAKEKYYTSQFKVTRSSHSSIKVGKTYNVFEYGPFGSMCEMYEMEANVDPELVGEKNHRLLILYKNNCER